MCNHRTVYTHAMAKFIRSMLHIVTCNDVLGLLKLSRALRLER